MSTGLENAILVTGAGQRIGFYLVKKFLQEGNFPVVFTYRSYKPGVQELIDAGAIGIQSDFTETDALPKLVAAIKQSCLSLRAVIHNASIWLSDNETPCAEKAYKALFQVHVDAPIYLNEALKPLLIKSSAPLKDIIALTDDALTAGHAEQVHYLASKAALSNATLSFAKKYAPIIKVNEIAPGLIIFNPEDSPAYQAQRLAKSALPIEPGETVIWQAVSYVLNNPYLTGSVQRVNGGKHLK